MTRIARILPLAVLALLLSVGSAAAQTIPSRYRYIEETQRLGVFAGYLALARGLEVNDSVSIPIGPRSAPVVGVRYGVRLSGALDFQTSLSVIPTSRDLWSIRFSADSTVRTPQDLEESVSATIVEGDVGLRLSLTGPRTWNGIAPYAGVSAGLVTDLRGVQEAEEEIPDLARFRVGPSFALGANLGTDWFLAPRTSLRIDLQGKLWRMSTPEGFVPGRRSGRGEWNPGIGVNVGGAIHF
jgi:hypothetical protein